MGNIVAWLLFGAIVGVVANLIDPKPSEGGLFGAIVLGVVGAIVGGFLASLLFGIQITGFNFSSIFVAVAGALLLLFTRRALGAY